MSNSVRWANLCYGDKFAMIFGFIMSVIVLIFPFICMIVVLRKRTRLNACIKSGEKYKADFIEDVFSELFTDLKEVEVDNNALFLVPIMLTRRISLTLMCYYWTTDVAPLFQVVLFILQSFAYLWYLIAVMPYEEAFLNKIEIFNELVTLLIGYHLLTFTEMNQDRSVKNHLGYTMVGCCLFDVLVNLTLVTKSIGTKLLRFFKKKLKKEEEVVSESSESSSSSASEEVKEE